MSASTIPGPAASLAAEVGPSSTQAVTRTVVAGYQAAAAPLAAPVPLGSGVGVKQVVIENWNNTPYVFMINTNDELYYGHLTTTLVSTLPYKTANTFSGWTFVTGAAKEITVDLGKNNNPYIYLINTNNDLYYGNLSTGTAFPSNQVAFSGWSFLTGAAKDVTVGQWNGNTYIYLINTNNDLYFGNWYTTTSTTFPPVPSQTLFAGWNFITGAAKQVSVDLWRGYPYLYLINSNDELYYGNLYFAQKTLPPPIGHASFSGWNFITGAAKQVTVSQWQNNPYLYLINSKDELYYGNLSALSSSATIPPGTSKFSGWNFITGAAKQVAVGQWQNNPYLYLINSNDNLYYGNLYTAQTQTGPSTFTSYTAFSGWTFLTGAAKQITSGTWQSNPYLYLINSNDDLFFSNLYTALISTLPYKTGTAFSGWSPF
ncbi:MAG: hypothetical protein P4L85_12075 [Paludisphaera borealis]|uniref:hypothetical protein n=1 Tax=Paludisphaera borealis TaxID=1387353 RepID=UPI00284FBD68|nr:hypothetical protein [Paludisphaera borealis]MDR3620080.1 hypothetical protein [Paludisphaera borealis]